MEQNPLAALAPLHILVVDDDPLIACIAADHFAALGLRVTCANNGIEALREMELALPDLILCDRRMPDMSGAESLQEAALSRHQSTAFTFREVIRQFHPLATRTEDSDQQWPIADR